MKATLKRHPEGWFLQLPDQVEKMLGESREVEIKLLKGGLWIQPITQLLEELEAEPSISDLDLD